MSLPAIENLTLFAGHDLRARAQFLQVDGSPLPCPEAGLEGTITQGETVLAELVCDFTDRAAGIVEVKLPAAAVDAVPEGVHTWGLTFVDADGSRTPVMAGAAVKRGFPSLSSS